MKTHWKILIVIGVFLLVMSLVSLLMMRISPMNTLEAYKKSLRDRGEKVEFSELSLPLIPAESNSVEAVEHAFYLFGSGEMKIPYAMQMVAPGRALIGWRQPDACGYGFTNTWDDFCAEETADRPAITLLHQVLDRPQLDFHLDYQQGFTLLLPQLVSLKRAIQKLDVATVCDLQAGDAGAATTNILTMLGLVQRDETEGLVISHLVRLAMMSIAVTPTWEFLQATNSTDAQLAMLQDGWQQINLLKNAEYAFTIERPWGIDFVQKARASHEGFVKAFDFGGGMVGSRSSSGSWDWEEVAESARGAMGEAMWRSSWSYNDELSELQANTVAIDALRSMQTNQSQCYQADLAALEVHLAACKITNAGAAFFNVLKIPDLGDLLGDPVLSGVVRKTIRMEAARRVVVTAIALKRYQLKHGGWPASLAELMPQFLSSVPIDPYDGKLLRYHPNPDGTYLLYCVGDDGVDDEGDPNLKPGMTSSSLDWQYFKTRDWVWPQPATAAEIQAFYARPPK